MRIARMTSTRKPSTTGRPSTSRPRKPHKQRCAIRVTYSPNQVRGQWAAHGRYIARESANSEGIGFTIDQETVTIPTTLGEWQKAGDPRLFKIIVSPEFGERLDLKKHTRDLMTRLSQELNAELEWIAVAHFNTGHPHVHVALRGITPAGNLRLPREVIKHSIRHHAEDLCTEQLGFRTINDAIESERREINALHVTSLDREIHIRMTAATQIQGKIELSDPQDSGLRQLHIHHLSARLQTLSKLDLAKSTSEGRWLLNNNFLERLGEVQNLAPRRHKEAKVVKQKERD